MRKSVFSLLLFVLTLLPPSAKSFEVGTGLGMSPYLLNGENCTSSVGCPILHFCNKDGMCQHKELQPLTWLEAVGYVLIVVVSGLANAGGMGGGTIMTPILFVVMRYRSSYSVLISHVLVLGGSTGNLFSLIRAKDTHGYPMINYDVAAMIVPLLISGAVFGVVLNRVLAEAITLTVITILLLAILLKIMAKFRSTLDQEEFMRQQARTNSSNVEERQSLKSEHMQTEVDVLSYSSDNENNNGVSTRLRQLLVKERRQFPLGKNVMLFFLVALVVLLNMVQGSRRYPSMLGVVYCSWAYWALQTSIILAGFIAFAVNRRLAVNSYKEKIELGFPFDDEFRLTPNITFKLNSIALFTGFLVGVAGMGGGMIMSPMLMELGLATRKAAATSGYTVVFTSFISVSISLANGFLETELVLVYLLLSLVGGYTISRVLHALVVYFRRESILLGILAFIILLTFIISPAFGIYKLATKSKEALTFGSIC